MVEEEIYDLGICLCVVSVPLGVVQFHIVALFEGLELVHVCLL